ncbi:hypothetical protein JT358_00080 [Micrococcales bacterium 31B]|nr:hypothetical protein [Micrococcales bacterium 31B]
MFFDRLPLVDRRAAHQGDGAAVRRPKRALLPALALAALVAMSLGACSTPAQVAPPQLGSSSSTSAGSSTGATTPPATTPPATTPGATDTATTPGASTPAATTPGATDTGTTPASTPPATTPPATTPGTTDTGTTPAATPPVTTPATSPTAVGLELPAPKNFDEASRRFNSSKPVTAAVFLDSTGKVLCDFTNPANQFCGISAGALPLPSLGYCPDPATQVRVIAFKGAEAPELRCSPPNTFPNPAPVAIKYGESSQTDGVQVNCVSESFGIICVDFATRHGFYISDTGYTRF